MKILEILICVAAILFGLFLYAAFAFSNVEIEDTKSYNELTLDDEDRRDYYILTDEFLTDETSKYDVLKNIDLDLRMKLAAYMKSDDLKIKPGTYYIKKRVIENGVSICDMTEGEVFEIFDFVE